MKENLENLNAEKAKIVIDYLKNRRNGLHQNPTAQTSGLSEEEEKMLETIERYLKERNEKASGNDIIFDHHYNMAKAWNDYAEKVKEEKSKGRTK